MTIIEKKTCMYLTRDCTVVDVTERDAAMTTSGCNRTYLTRDCTVVDVTEGEAAMTTSGCNRILINFNYL